MSACRWAADLALGNGEDWIHESRETSTLDRAHGERRSGGPGGEPLPLDGLKLQLGDGPGHLGGRDAEAIPAVGSSRARTPAHALHVGKSGVLAQGEGLVTGGTPNELHVWTGDGAMAEGKFDRDGPGLSGDAVSPFRGEVNTLRHGILPGVRAAWLVGKGATERKGHEGSRARAVRGDHRSGWWETKR